MSIVQYSLPMAQPLELAQPIHNPQLFKQQKTICFTAADLAQLPRTILTVSDSKGTRIAYEGVLQRKILQRAGVLQGEQLRDSNLARYLVEAADGWEVVFSLPEFDKSVWQPRRFVG